MQGYAYEDILKYQYVYETSKSLYKFPPSGIQPILDLNKIINKNVRIALICPITCHLILQLGYFFPLFSYLIVIPTTYTLASLKANLVEARSSKLVSLALYTTVSEVGTISLFIVIFILSCDYLAICLVFLSNVKFSKSTTSTVVGVGISLLVIIMDALNFVKL
jgi:hypothetical protein